MMTDDLTVDDLAEIAELHDPNRATQNDLADAQELDDEHLRNADSIAEDVTQRLSDVSSMHRTIDKLKPDIAEKLDVLDEMQDDEEVYDNYIRDDPKARDYVDNLLALISLYQRLVDNFTPANIMLHKTTEQLEELVDEQQLRHDESFVLKHTTNTVQDMKESFEDSLESLKQSHESTNDELLTRFDRMLERHSRVSDNQVKMQESMADMAAVLEELAGSFDTARGNRLEQKLSHLEEELIDKSDEG